MTAAKAEQSRLDLQAHAGRVVVRPVAIALSEKPDLKSVPLAEIPAKTAQSDAMSKALSRAGFKFVGSTICYAFMQASGMVNDHLVCWPRHGDVQGRFRE